MTKDFAKHTFCADAGLAVRGQLRRIVKMIATTNGVLCEVEEDKGWLSSLFTFTFSGPKDAVNTALEQVAKLKNEYE